MTHSTIARDMLAVLSALQGIGTLAIDLGAKHASNPAWPRHARFHVVWQSIGTATLAAVAAVLAVYPGSLQDRRFYLAALLTAIPMLAFFAALLGRKLYGGALSDPTGIQPAKIQAFGAELRIDLNLATEAIASLALVFLVALY